MTDSTIRLSPHATFWVLFFALLLMALLVLSEILLPFILGFVFAYLFHPIVNRMARIRVHRGAAAFVIVAILILIIAVVLSIIVPPLLDQLGQLIKNLPGYVASARAYIDEHYILYIDQHFPILRRTAAQPGGDVQQQLAQNVASWAISQLQGLLQGGFAIFNSLALLVLTPVVTFFLLRDWDKMIQGIAQLVPRQDAPAIKELAKEINWTIAGYLRGTLIVLLIVSAFYMVALGMIGLNYGLIIGLVAGMISFIPYLGSTSGFLVSGGVAMAQYWPDYTKVLLVCAVFVFGQVIEGNVLTPNIVGNKVRLHPVWLLFALIASGYLLGFTGLLISVPLAAAIGVVVRYAIRQYYGSEMYDSEGEPARESPVSVA